MMSTRLLFCFQFNLILPPQLNSSDFLSVGLRLITEGSCHLRMASVFLSPCQLHYKGGISPSFSVFPPVKERHTPTSGRTPFPITIGSFLCLCVRKRLAMKTLFVFLNMIFVFSLLLLTSLCGAVAGIPLHLHGNQEISHSELP